MQAVLLTLERLNLTTPAQPIMMPAAKFLTQKMLQFGIALAFPVALFSAIAAPTYSQSNDQSRALMLRSDVQEADARTGIVTARGNVQIDYPARQMQATAAQAQYFSRERRIVLSGDVYILQQGNSLRGETVTYLIDEGRFIALPETNQQVESIYIVPETTTAPTATSSNTAPAQLSPVPNF